MKRLARSSFSYSMIFVSVIHLSLLGCSASEYEFLFEKKTQLEDSIHKIKNYRASKKNKKELYSSPFHQELIDTNCADVTDIASIPVDGLVITMPGIYRVTQNLSFKGERSKCAIFVKASNVLIDFNGYTLTITGQASAIFSLNVSNLSINRPILLTQQQQGYAAFYLMNTKNGRIVSPYIENFSLGLRAVKCTDFFISKPVVKKTGDGFIIEKSETITMNHGVIETERVGFFLLKSKDCTIASSSIQSQISVSAQKSSKSLIENSILSAKKVGLELVESKVIGIKNCAIYSDDTAVHFVGPIPSSLTALIASSIQGKNIGIALDNGASFGSLISGCSVRGCLTGMNNVGTKSLIRSNNFFGNKVNGLSNNSSNIVENAIF